MGKLDLQGIPVGAQIMLTLIIIFLSFLITMTLGALAGTLFFDNSITEILGLADFTDKSNLPLLKYLQITQSIGLFIIPPFIAASLFGSTISSYLKIRNKPYPFVLIIVIILAIISIPFINYLAELNANVNLPDSMERIENWMKEMEETAAELTEMLISANTFDVFLLNLFMIAVLPALGEELLFRGVIQKQLTRFFRNHHAGIWVAAILFSALHMQFYGFIPRMFLGVLFGYLLVWTGSIWIPITAHFVNNASAVLFYYLFSNDMVNEELETIGATESDMYYVIASMAGMFIFLFLIYRYQKIRSNYRSLSG
jgi:uncharacterized protein